MSKRGVVLCCSAVLVAGLTGCAGTAVASRPGPTATVTVTASTTVSAVTTVTALATVTSTVTAPAAAPQPAATLPTAAPPAPAPADVYYANCTAVRAAGKAPLLVGQPGYRSGLDRDGDGVACE